MRRIYLPKGQLKFPDPKYIYDRNGKDDIVKYIQMFDRINQLVSGGTLVKGIQI